MAKQVKNQKSAHLKGLEEVFERRTRRFSPFEILGLKANVDDEKEGDQTPTSSSESADELNIPKDLYPPMEGSDPPTPGPQRPRGGVGRPSPGVGRPTRVVEEYINTSTTEFPPMEGSGPPTPGPQRPRDGSSILFLSQPLTGNEQPLTEASEKQELDFFQADSSEQGAKPSSHQTISTVADVVAATQAGTQIGPKARNVLAYLNTIRSIEHETHTVPVGYGQISAQVGVDSDYLRRKALPKLAMLGFIAIAKKSLEGTVYHLPHSRDYIAAVIGESHSAIPLVTASLIPVAEVQPKAFSWPEWIDKEQWGWMSQETIQRLVQKAGSEAQAREKLEIIIYNETHGIPHQRVRNRRSVLAHYLAMSQAEIWPNDDGFETLTMRRARFEKEQAQKEKALAEEALRTKRETQKIQFYASLSDSQLQWIKHEAKRIVDVRPEAKLLTSRFPLYKAEEDRLIEEWMERVEYGETVPSIQKEFN